MKGWGGHGPCAAPARPLRHVSVPGPAEKTLERWPRERHVRVPPRHCRGLLRPICQVLNKAIRTCSSSMAPRRMPAVHSLNQGLGPGFTGSTLPVLPGRMLKNRFSASSRGWPNPTRPGPGSAQPHGLCRTALPTTAPAADRPAARPCAAARPRAASRRLQAKRCSGPVRELSARYHARPPVLKRSRKCPSLGFPASTDRGMGPQSLCHRGPWGQSPMIWRHFLVPPAEYRGPRLRHPARDPSLQAPGAPASSARPGSEEALGHDQHIARLHLDVRRDISGVHQVG